jgi:hypothetical protein
VKARQHDNVAIRHGVDQAVRKSTNSRTAKLPPHSLILKRVLPDRGKRPIDGANEIGAQPRPSLIVPVAGSRDFGFGLGFK